MNVDVFAVVIVTFLLIVILIQIYYQNERFSDDVPFYDIYPSISDDKGSRFAYVANDMKHCS